MDRAQRKGRMVFALTEAQVMALLDLANDLSRLIPRNSVLERAFDGLDEQRANQQRQWERCDECGGSGWIEDKP